MPSFRRILRPLFVTAVAANVPIVFYEDLPFARTVEQLVSDRSFYKKMDYRVEFSNKVIMCAI